MIKKVFLYLAFAIFVAGCENTHPSFSVLYEEFSRYESTANKNNIIEMASVFFSPSLLGRDYQNNPDAIDQLLFKDYMTTAQDHYEKVNKNVGCLTINGYDEDKSPIIISLKYIRSNSNWLIDNIHIIFVENKKDFADSVKCPSDFSN